ncbi:MAG: hypothetical protein JKX72_01130 [Robiginitomaculum sp.]|nr:hypothetical protein [Robiginitomaculum sp.]
MIAKVLVSAGITMYTLLPFAVDFGTSHIGAEHWSPHARFHLTWVLYGNLIALPIMLFAIWSKLHGTGRSVRFVAFLGMAYTLGFYVANALSGKYGTALHDDGHEHLVLGVDGNLISTSVIFCLFLLGAIISIRPKNT